MVQDFVKKLKTHLLARHNNAVSAGDEPEYSDAELRKVHINNSRIYEHQTATFNYTTYDVRREQDTIECMYAAWDYKTDETVHRCAAIRTTLFTEPPSRHVTTHL